MEEIWKPIDHPQLGKYFFISNFGNVKSTNPRRAKDPSECIMNGILKVSMEIKKVRYVYRKNMIKFMLENFGETSHGMFNKKKETEWRWVAHIKYRTHVKVSKKGEFKRHSHKATHGILVEPFETVKNGEPCMCITLKRNGSTEDTFIAAHLILETYGDLKPKNWTYKVGYKDNDFKNLELDNLYWIKIKSKSSNRYKVETEKNIMFPPEILPTKKQKKKKRIKTVPIPDTFETRRNRQVLVSQLLSDTYKSMGLPSH